MVVFVPSLGMGVVVGAHAAPGLARGSCASLGRGGSMPRGSNAFVLTLQGSGVPVLTLQGSGEAEIISDRVEALLGMCSPMTLSFRH
jgi:hypothetical protein